MREEGTTAKGSWLARSRNRIGHVFHHEHEHGAAASYIDSGELGIRATKISLIGLGTTAFLQAVIFWFSGSVALLSDTLHNITDALTAIPLWIAFAVGRRPPTQRYTYGFNRAEDVAGLAIVIAIAATAGLVIWESIRRLIDPQAIDAVPWVIAAGVVGVVGNELVARYRIRVGRKIGSQALIADGEHARTDALTSVAVIAAGIGAAVGVDWIDPVAGLVVAVAILWLLFKTGREMARRLLDAVDPDLVDEALESIELVPGVIQVEDLKVRWHGHQLHINTSVCVDPDLSVKEGHDIAHDVEHGLHHRFSCPVVAIVHIEPHGDFAAHDGVAAHQEDHGG